MTLRFLLRIFFVVFATAFAVQALLLAYRGGPDPGSTPEVAMQAYATEIYLYAAVAALIAAAVVFVEWRFLDPRASREMVAVFFGLTAGLAVAAVLTLMLVMFLRPVSQSMEDAYFQVQPYIPLLLVCCSYLGITVVLKTKDDFRFLLPYIDFSPRGTHEGGLVLDTSALIDGRIVDLCATRLISIPVVVPDFVVRELQTLSDSHDRLKRMRGRRGLEMVKCLRENPLLRFVVRDTATPNVRDVDSALVQFAKGINGRIVTTDFNLAQVGQIEGVSVINMNDIAQAARAQAVPGEILTLRIVRPGQEPGQGVGYLSDGTMVVVEDGREYIEQEVQVSITGSHQTMAGRIIFGRLVSAAGKPEGDTQNSDKAKATCG